MVYPGLGTAAVSTLVATGSGARARGRSPYAPRRDLRALRPMPAALGETAGAARPVLVALCELPWLAACCAGLLWGG